MHTLQSTPVWQKSTPDTLYTISTSHTTTQCRTPSGCHRKQSKVRPQWTCQAPSRNIMLTRFLPTLHSPTSLVVIYDDCDSLLLSIYYRDNWGALPWVSMQLNIYPLISFASDFSGRGVGRPTLIVKQVKEIALTFVISFYSPCTSIESSILGQTYSYPRP